MDNKDGLLAYHEDSEFSFLDSGKEGHINEHAFVSDNVLLTESHELSEFVMLNVIVYRLSAFDFCIIRQGLALRELSLILNDNSPDARSN